MLSIIEFLNRTDGETVYTDEARNDTDFAIVLTWAGGAILNAWTITPDGVNAVDIRTNYKLTGDPDAAADAALSFLADLWNTDAPDETDGWDN